MHGWKREIVVRIGGKTKGTTEVVYTPDHDNRRLRSKQDLTNYCIRNNISSTFMTRFDFRNVFCVCHKAEESTVHYLECSFGLAGIK